jgi:hypothetical protein
MIFIDFWRYGAKIINFEANPLISFEKQQIGDRTPLSMVGVDGRWAKKS